MNQNAPKIFTAWIHPLLIGIYPVITLLAHNIDELAVEDGIRSLYLSFLLPVILLIIFYLFFKNWQKSALVVTLFILLFFSYGHIYSAIEHLQIFNFVIGRHRFLIIAWAGLFLLGSWWVKIRNEDMQNLTNTINLVAIVSVIMPVFQIIGSQINSERIQSQLLQTELNDQIFQIPSGQTPPDIYYIILDEYSRDDALETIFGFDNSPFLGNLEDLGFYIANCSQSNYSQTQLSLSSSLNMNFIEEIVWREELERNDHTRLGKLIKDPEIWRILQRLDYQLISFETGYIWSQNDDADLFLGPNQNLSENQRLSLIFNNFEIILLKSSAALIALDGNFLLPQESTQKIFNPDIRHREIVLFTLDQLELLAATPGPKFVFAHIVSPHIPYVFEPDGSMPKSTPDDDIGYINQIKYLNSRIEKIADTLISKSSTPPIIIIQGDHGQSSSRVDRMRILNAYYFPNQDYQNLSPNISPVNSFRVILNAYFDGNLPLLENSSYFSMTTSPYTFNDMPETQEECITVGNSP